MGPFPVTPQGVQTKGASVAFDPKRLSRLDWGVLVAGAIAFIALFLPWYGFSAPGFSASVSGWSTGYGLFGGLLLVAAAVWFFLWRAEAAIPKEGPLTPLVVTTGLAAVGLLLVVIRWASLPRGGGGILGRSFNYGPRVGIWLAVVMGVVEVVCAAILFTRSDEQLPWKSAGPHS